MGTRSLLAYEKLNEKIHVQYMQFDGYPSVKGKEYYEMMLNSLMEVSKDFFTSKGKPKAQFFKRIRHFLDNYMYSSGHSINDNWTINKNEWSAQDSGSVYRYIWRRNGDFEIKHYSDWEACIPWVFTEKLVRSFMQSDLFGYARKNSKLDPFWESLDRWEGKSEPPNLLLSTFLSHDWPDRGENGWENHGILNAINLIPPDELDEDKKKLYVDGVIVSDPETPAQKMKREEFEIKFESEYLTVLHSPEKDLPLLIGTLENEETQELLEERLK